jgi:hypothetical protein
MGSRSQILDFRLRKAGLGCRNKMMRTIFKIAVAVLLLLAPSLPAFAMISVGELSKEEAKELGITMKYGKNGDAGIRVWLEFKKEGFLEKFSYAEMRMKDANGNHLVSAMLLPRPMVHGQPEDIVSVAFSVEAGQLENCAFMVVAYGSTRGDVGYWLNVEDFIDLEKVAE